MILLLTKKINTVKMKLQMFAIIYKSVFFIYLLLLSIIDCKTYTINSSLLFLCFLSLLLTDIFFAKILPVEHFIAALILFVLFYIVYKYKKGLGLGDVKLAALIGYYAGLYKGIFSCFAGCIFALIFFAIKKNKYDKIPFAPFLSLGALVIELICLKKFS